MATSKGGRRAQEQQGEGERGEGEGLAMRENVARRYKHFFDEHSDEGGIPLRDLRELLTGDADLTPAKLDALLRRADADQDGILEYNEFEQLMASDEAQGLTPVQLTRFQRLVRTAVSSVTPRGVKAADGETEVVDDYVNHYNCCPPPLFMILISAAELGVFIGYAVWLKPHGVVTTMTSGAPLFSPLTFNPERRYEAWRFLSYMFIHDGVKHILCNLIFQLLLGIPLEMVHKFWRVGIVYCLGVLAGTLCTSVIDAQTFVVGASGGCYALIGAHFAIIIMNWKEMTHDWMGGIMKFILSAPVQLTFWGLFAAVDTGVAIWSRYSSAEGQRVAYSAHFAGLVAGVLIGVPVLRNFRQLPWERVVWWVCLIAYLVLVVLAVCLNVFLPNHYLPTDWTPCCPCPRGDRSCPKYDQPSPSVSPSTRAQ